MKKKRKIDFVLHESKDEIVVFRFYPRQSRCHSFNDAPPKSWSEVYKVYFSYRIFRRWKENNSTETLFKCTCDECSVIKEISNRIEYIVQGKKTISVSYGGEEYIIKLLDEEVFPMGYGVSWIIHKLSSEEYPITMWKWNNTGYRFVLDKDKLKRFGEYLNECSEYMLAHGDPI